MNKNIRITYTKDPVPCLSCGAETPASDLYHPKEFTLDVDGLKQMAQSRKERAEVYKLAREAKIDHYAYYERLLKARFKEHKSERARSSFSYDIVGKCANCGTPIKTTVEGRVLIEEPEEPTEIEIFRKMPMPEDKVLGQLLRLDVAWISEAEYADLLTLQKQAEVDPHKKVELEQKQEELKTRYPPSTIQWIKESLLKPPPDLTPFIEGTLRRLDKIELEESFKGEVKQFFEDFKEDVRREYNKKFLRYLNAVYRLARQNVGKSFYP